MCSNNKPHKPLSFYLTLAHTAFDYVIKSPFSAKYVNEKFITFISVLFYCLANNLALMPSFFTDPNIINESWSHYDGFIKSTNFSFFIKISFLKLLRINNSNSNRHNNQHCLIIRSCKYLIIHFTFIYFTLLSNSYTNYSYYLGFFIIITITTTTTTTISN